MLCAEISNLLPHFDGRMLPGSFPSRPEMGRDFSEDSNLQPRRKTERYKQRGFPNTWSDKVNADRLHSLAESF